MRGTAKVLLFRRGCDCGSSDGAETAAWRISGMAKICPILACRAKHGVNKGGKAATAECGRPLYQLDRAGEFQLDGQGQKIPMGAVCKHMSIPRRGRNC